MGSEEERSMDRPAIIARGVTKSFGGAPALRGVDVSVDAGECHAVMGENGAGKSTLMRIVCGLERPDAGEIAVFGQTLESGARHSRDAGIALVHQERSLVPELTVAENICLGTTPVRAGVVDRRAMRRAAADLLRRVGSDVRPSTRAGSLSSAQQQFVEIAKALRQEPRVLILDEPSASMTPEETGRLLALLRELAQAGIAIIYVSHRLPEIYALCTSATVLRDGALVGRYDLAVTSKDELVERMVGRELEHDLKVDRRVQPGRVALDVRGLSAEGVRDVSFTVRAGEIVGLGGLVGAGRSEIVRAALGLHARTAGHVSIGCGDEHIPLRSYSSALKNGVAFVPEERRDEGVLLGMSVEENLTLPTRQRTARWGFGRRALRRARAEGVVSELRVRTRTTRQLVSTLSGGNQQKVALGKWLLAEPSILVLDEPTRGVDVGAKAEIHDIIRREADRGAAVLLVSSDLPELLSLSDRIMIIRDGRIVGEVHGDAATESAVIRLAAGHAEVA